MSDNLYISTLLFIYLLTGCSGGAYEPAMALPDSLFVKHPDYAMINVFSVDKPLKLEQIATDIEFVPLETSQDALFKYSDEFFLNDSLIILDARYHVLYWNRKGKFLRRFQNIGRGPKEYTVIRGMAVDFKTNKMAIADTRFIKLYSLDGHFIRLFKLPELPFALNPNITFLNSTHLIVENDRFKPYYKNGFSPLWSINLKTEESFPLFQAYPDSVQHFEQIFTFYGEIFNGPEKGMLYSARESYNIYHISEDQEISLIYQMDFGEYQMPVGIIHEGFKFSRIYRFLFISISDIKATERYLFVRYGKVYKGQNGGFKQGYFVYDKKERKLIANQLKSKGFISTEYPNLYFWPITITPKGKLVCLHSAEAISKSDILSRVKKGDNPILSFITLK